MHSVTSSTLVEIITVMVMAHVFASLLHYFLNKQ